MPPEKQPQSPQKRLTKKAEIFAETYAKTGDKTLSAIAAFDTTNPDSARAMASKLLQKDSVIQAIEIKRKSLKQALIDKGIDEDKIAEKVGVLLEATDKDGNTDYTAVDKGLKHATVIHGVTDPSDTPRQQNTYNFIFSAPVQARVHEIEAEIKGLITKKPNVQTP